MVAVAQLVEPRIVIPVVVGSRPISHPIHSEGVGDRYCFLSPTPFYWRGSLKLAPRTGGVNEWDCLTRRAGARLLPFAAAGGIVVGDIPHCREPAELVLVTLVTAVKLPFVAQHASAGQCIQYLVESRATFAIEVLASAVETHPDDLELLYQLITLLRDEGSRQQALLYAYRLRRLAPGQPAIENLVRSLSANQPGS